VLIVVGIPTYDNRVHAQLMLALLNEICRPDTPPMVVLSNHSSLLARGFNELWCYALNHRPQATHFLMIHADIIPETGFAKRMVDEMDSSGAGVLSVAMPLKDGRGITSTALDGSEPRRVTLRELDGLPGTFDRSDLEKHFGQKGMLLVNSGLMLVDLRQNWVDKCYFAINDYVRRRADGKFEPVTDSEDWFFSRAAQKAGARVVANHSITARHAGEAMYPNRGAWGTHGRDDADRSTKDA
jgi:GT2 family glycosyltransferase